MSLFSWHSLALLSYALLAFATLRWLVTTIHTLYFHPLSHFPGPKSWLIFPVLRNLENARGQREQRMLQHHERYGPVVRCAPDILTFSSAAAWKDIYGHGHAELPKVQGGPPAAVPHIFGADSKTHFRYRRAMLPAFSDKALAEQEELLLGYTNLLMQQLQDHAQAKERVDMVQWLNFTTFDVIGDLAFGEPLGGLERGATNVWMERIHMSSRVMPFLIVLQSVPMLASVVEFLAGDRLRKSQYEHQAMVAAMVQKGIQKSGGEEQELTNEELAANADIMIAGSETIATTLAGVTYLLLSAPGGLKRCTEEVRSAFQKKEDITFTAASSKLPYMMACLNEALRLYPPLPAALLRETRPGTITPVAGYMVPEKTKVGIPQLAAFQSSHNWHRPKDFLPERWLSDAQSNPQSPFFNDQREAHKPFSFGPRDCIGRNLAFHEMRLILARLLWEFDLSPCKQSQDWMSGQRDLTFWDKPPLMVGIHERTQ